MRNILFAVLVFGVSAFGFAQGIYNEAADANRQLDEAIERAKSENKFVLAQVGGNWCKWCLIFNDFVTKNTEIDSLMKQNFVFIHINYSPKNKNEETMKRLGNPQRFGFPVLVFLDGNGERIHTQNSAYLEKDNSYSKEKVFEMLKNWTPTAVVSVK